MPKPAFNREMEGLRGLAALMVVASHLSLFRNFLDPDLPAMGMAFQQAHYAVLIFFALSGYVIGLTNRPEPGTPALTWTKR